MRPQPKLFQQQEASRRWDGLCPARVSDTGWGLGLMLRTLRQAETRARALPSGGIFSGTFFTQCFLSTW